MRMEKQNTLMRIGMLLLAALVLSPDVARAEPTLQETLDWLKEKITNEGSFRLWGECRNVTAHGNRLLVEFKNEKLNYSLAYDIPLAELESAYDGDRTVVVRIDGGERKIKKTFYNNEPAKVEWDHAANIDFPTQELSSRVAKAFAHAIKLLNTQSPKKKEPF